MTLETDFISGLRAIATDPGARGLMDDAAMLGDLVLTHDMIVEGVHSPWDGGVPDRAPQPSVLVRPEGEALPLAVAGQSVARLLQKC